MATKADKTGWFADVDAAEDAHPKYHWLAVLQTEGVRIPLEGIWFASEEECLKFIREAVIGQGLHDKTES